MKISIWFALVAFGLGVMAGWLVAPWQFLTGGETGIWRCNRITGTVEFSGASADPRWHRVNAPGPIDFRPDPTNAGYEVIEPAK